MAAGTNPIFVATPNFGGIGNATITAANTAKDGTGTVVTVFTAGLNGAFVKKIRFVPAGSNTATVARLFINNGSTNATATNNVLHREFTLPTITLNETFGQSDFEFVLDLPIPAGFKLTVVLGTAVAAGWTVSVVGGDF